MVWGEWSNSFFLTMYALRKRVYQFVFLNVVNAQYVFFSATVSFHVRTKLTVVLSLVYSDIFILLYMMEAALLLFDCPCLFLTPQ